MLLCGVGDKLAVQVTEGQRACDLVNLHFFLWPCSIGGDSGQAGDRDRQ